MAKVGGGRLDLQMQKYFALAFSYLISGESGGRAFRSPDAEATHDRGNRQSVPVVGHPAKHLLLLKDIKLFPLFLHECLIFISTLMSNVLSLFFHNFYIDLFLH